MTKNKTKSNDQKINDLKESLLDLTDFVEELAQTFREADIRDLPMFNLVANLDKLRKKIQSI